MEDPMQYIDDFFQGKLSKEEINHFENKIIQNQGFAESVAFYLSAKETAKEQLLRKRRKDIKKSIAPPMATIVLKLNRAPLGKCGLQPQPRLA